jgi:hypothetical protein
MARFFTYRFGGVRQFLGPVSGLSYTFVKDGITRVDREDDGGRRQHLLVDGNGGCRDIPLSRG